MRNKALMGIAAVICAGFLFNGLFDAFSTSYNSIETNITNISEKSLLAY